MKNTKGDDSLSATSLTLVADQREESNIKNPECNMGNVSLDKRENLNI